MVRKTHGHYDATTGLPDNNMQPVGNGYNVWLNEQALVIFGVKEGQRLIDLSASHKERRYTWLCSELAQAGHQEIVDEYHRRRKAADAQRRLEDKQRTIRIYQHELEDPLSTRADYLRREIAKCQKYIDERTN